MNSMITPLTLTLIFSILSGCDSFRNYADKKQQEHQTAAEESNQKLEAEVKKAEALVKYSECVLASGNSAKESAKCDQLNPNKGSSAQPETVEEQAKKAFDRGY